MDEKYAIDGDFLDSTHGKLGCASCHGGDAASTEKAVAHKGVLADPSVNADATCGKCHSQAVAQQKNSLHATLRGFETVLGQRGGHPANVAGVKQGYDNHCAKCHTSCGQCHVSRPTNTYGGLLAGHKFRKTPPIKETCVGCHATRVGPEYLGNHAGVSGDVHWTKGGMVCTKCHSTDLHGGEKQRDHRYDSPTAQCQTCHNSASTAQVTQHSIHGDKLSCQVCHSVPYKNCASCHTGIDSNGAKFFRSEEPEMTFKIGRNPLASASRPQNYVVVRHTPADPALFDFYGSNLFPAFDQVPTWKFATPHNIQRLTPQNKTCDSCHGHPELFLQASDIATGEVEANKDVIVQTIPPKMGQ